MRQVRQYEQKNNLKVGIFALVIWYGNFLAKFPEIPKLADIFEIRTTRPNIPGSKKSNRSATEIPGEKMSKIWANLARLSAFAEIPQNTFPFALVPAISGDSKQNFWSSGKRGRKAEHFGTIRPPLPRQVSVNCKVISLLLFLTKAAICIFPCFSSRNVTQKPFFKYLTSVAIPKKTRACLSY